MPVDMPAAKKYDEKNHQRQRQQRDKNNYPVALAKIDGQTKTPVLGNHHARIHPAAIEEAARPVFWIAPLALIDFFAIHLT